MPVNFPNSPSNDDEHSANGLVYKYNSAKGAWKRKFVAPTDATDINQLNDSSGLLTSSSTTVVADMAALIALTGMSSGDQAYITANNKLYFYNGSGWYLIATVQNDAPSAITGVNGTYELAIDGTATTITAVSTDPEGFPLTWSSSTSGLGSIATVSNTDNVFTITPSTTEADAGTFTLTINATDGANGAVSTSTNLTLNFIVIVTNSRYTTLLATATGTSDNNNITDSSSNNHSITVNGDAHAGTFSPYRSGGYSTYFDGTDRVYLTNDMSVALGTSEFSMEAWIYRTTTDADENVIVNGPSNDYGWGLAISGGKIRARFHNTNLISGATTVSPNEWHHVMIARTSSNELLIFLDGTLDARSTSSSINYNATSATLTIGSYGDRTGAVSFGFNGYIRDARVIVGYNTFPHGSYGTSVGINYFTPPSEPLTAVSGTEALLCGLPYHGDLSSNGHSVSETGGAVTKPFSPYDSIEYSVTDHGGSVYFVGGANFSSQYLSLSGPTMPSGDFTLSTWAYLKSNGSDTTLIDFNGNSDGFRIIYMNTGSNYHFRFYVGPGGSVYLYDSTSAHPLNQWHYIVVVRSSGTFKLYVNNKLMGTSTANPTFSSSNNVRIGQGLNGYGTLEGYLSDIIYNPTTAITDFTPPTAPQSSTGTTLHIKGADASIIDKSQVNNIKMNGPTTGSATKSAFGSEPTISFASGSNTNRYLEFDPTVLKFMEILGQPSIPFTIEGIWGWQGSTASPIFEIFQDTNNFFYFGGGPGNTQSGISTDMNLYAIFKIGGVERFKMTAGIGSYYNVGSSFKHQAITRNSSGVMQHYYDGQLRPNTITHSGTDTVNWASPVGYVGRSDWMGIYGRYEGYIHQVRLTVGLARYTANFTPPTASLEG